MKLKNALISAGVVGALASTALFSIDREPAARSRITGGDESVDASVYAENSKNRLATDTTIKGGTTDTKIGNVGDRLKVDAQVTLAGGATQSYTPKLRYNDMNATTGSLARGVSVTAASGWNRVYTYNGSGLLSGFIISLESKDDWAIRLVIDGEELFGANGFLSTDLHTDSIYDSDTSGRSVPELDQDLGVYWGAHDRFMWASPLLIPTSYTSSVNIYIRRTTGASSKKFQAGYVIIEKKT